MASPPNAPTAPADSAPWRLTRAASTRDRPLIVLTRLNESQFAINPDLIERISENPDTTLVMIDGAKYIVTESMDEVISRIVHYRAGVIALAYDPERNPWIPRP
jgi:flagellar protein FlbD